MANNIFVRTYNNREDIVKNERIFINNPVIFQGIGLAPLIVAGRTFQNAIILSVTVFLLLVSTRVVAAVFTQIINVKFRGVLYTMTAAVCYVGVFFVLNRLFGISELLRFQLYIPVIIMDPIIIKRYERKSEEPIETAFSKGIKTALGFAAAIILIGSLREFLAYGTLAGRVMVANPFFPMARLVSGGFIITGVVAALWKYSVVIFWNIIYRGARNS